MTELEKLDRYLTDHKIPHVKRCLPYFDKDGTLITGEENQIIVYKQCSGNKHAAGTHDIDNIAYGVAAVWDAVCYNGTTGADRGLLEIMGEIVDYGLFSQGLGVEGNLTADDIIKRLESKRRAKNEPDSEN